MLWNLWDSSNWKRFFNRKTNWSRSSYNYRTFKKKGKVWIRVFPDYPRTAKPTEVRMGRGKGNVDHWICLVKPGKILFEVSSNDLLNIKEALSFALRKLPFFAQIVTLNVKL